MKPVIELQDLGRIDYKKAWDYQEKLFKQALDLKAKNRREGSDELPKNYLLYCEHNPVYTLGKSGNAEHLKNHHDADYYEINRGGDITYHGPGQITGYPIFDLEQFGIGLREYIYRVEEVMIKLLADYSITATRIDEPNASGVWLDVDDPKKVRKICAIGVKSSRYVTMHGFAFNVNTDLGYFNHIIPCGIPDKGVTSLQKELDHEVDMNKVKQQLAEKFAEVFNAQIPSPAITPQVKL